MKEYFMEFYQKVFKENMQKKFIIIFSIIIIIALLGGSMFNKEVLESLGISTKTTLIFKDTLLKEIITVGLLILSSIVPYMYTPYIAIPVIGLLVGIEMFTAPHITIFVLISGLLKIMAYSFAIVLGGMLCKKTTIMYRKTSVKNDEIINTKRDMYLAVGSKKAKEKVEKMDKKIKEKIKKLEAEEEGIILNGQVFLILSILVLIFITLSVLVKFI